MVELIADFYSQALSESFIVQTIRFSFSVYLLSNLLVFQLFNSKFGLAGYLDFSFSVV
jgi:hypothetical protein